MKESEGFVKQSSALRVKLGKAREVPYRRFIMGGGAEELQNETTSPTALSDPNFEAVQRVAV